MAGVSIYYFAGDFARARRNHLAGEPQVYATHGEVMRLVDDLLADGHHVRIVSFVTDVRGDEELEAGLRYTTLGASSPAERGLLGPTAASDDADFIIPHFPNGELLKAAGSTRARLFAMLASSWVTAGPRTRWEVRKVVRLLRRDRFEWVANHCRPAAEHLADLGVPRSKLLAWDVPHGPGPAGESAKVAPEGSPWVVFYVGAVTEAKGVADLVDALGVLRGGGRPVRLVVAGGGAVAEMEQRARDLGVDGDVELVGPISNDEAQRRMRAADVVAVPSRHEFPEGLPLTLFEAVASRTPVVCSDHPMFVRDFVDGRSASTFRAGDPTDLAAAILRLMDDPDLYAALSRDAEATWAGLTRTADMRTMLGRWVNDDAPSTWVREHTLDALG